MESAENCRCKGLGNTSRLFARNADERTCAYFFRDGLCAVQMFYYVIRSLPHEAASSSLGGGASHILMQHHCGVPKPHVVLPICKTASGRRGGDWSEKTFLFLILSTIAYGPMWQLCMEYPVDRCWQISFEFISSGRI